MKKIYPIIRYTILPVFNTFIKSVSGLENIPDGPFIIAANSGSSIDSLVLARTFIVHKNRMFRAITKKTAFYKFFGERICRWAGTIALDTNNKAAILDTAAELLKKGGIVLMYPEGMRTRDGEMNKAKTGVARLVLRSKVPVVPIGVKGGFEVFPRGSLFPRKLGKRIEIHIGKPMTFEKYYDKEIDKVMLDEITTTIMETIAALIGKKYPSSKQP